MGQRLVIAIEKNEKDLAKIYYHWSGYSESALYEAKEVLEYLGNDYENKTDREIQLSLIRFVESRGGCIDGGIESKEGLAIQEIFPNEDFSVTGSRNQGLIAITEDGMNDIQSWSEGDLIIDLTEKEIQNEVLDFFLSVDELNEYMEENYKLEDLKKLQYDPELFSFDSIDDVIKEINETFIGYTNNGVYLFIM